VVSRRTVLAGMAAVVGAVALTEFDSPGRRQLLDHLARDLGGGGPVPDLTLSVERDADLCLLDFFFYDFMVDTSSSPTKLTPTSADNTIIVRFPPQAIGEAAYISPQPVNDNTGLDLDPPPVLSALSGPSQVAFALDPDLSIPLPTMTATDLLEWSGWHLTVPASAQVDFNKHGTQPSPPQPLDTAIEFPYALYLSPTQWIGDSGEVGSFTNSFVNRATPLVGPFGVTDLFTSVLTRSLTVVKVDGGFADLAYPPELVATWAKDITGYDPGATNRFDATPIGAISYGGPPQ
jgi:hypothetical protein